MPEQSFDALVVGAGFAGAAAASVLQGAGLRTVVLEARSRAGGRAFTRTVANSADVLEFGGAWVTPAQHRIRHYARKCDFLLRPTAKIVARRWHDGSVLRRDAPAAPADLQGARPAADPRRYSLAELTAQPEETLGELHRPLPLVHRQRHVIE